MPRIWRRTATALSEASGIVVSDGAVGAESSSSLKKTGTTSWTSGMEALFVASGSSHAFLRSCFT